MGCAYCGHVEECGPGATWDDKTRAMAAHIVRCEKHPAKQAAEAVAEADERRMRRGEWAARWKAAAKLLWRNQRPPSDKCEGCGEPTERGYYTTDDVCLCGTCYDGLANGGD
jgi:hypothetical protein